MWWYSCKNSGGQGQKWYRSVIPICYSKKAQEINYHKRCLVSGSRHVCLLNNDTQSHIYHILKQFLKLKKVTCTVLSHSTNYPDPAPCEFFLFSEPFQKSILRLKLCTSSRGEHFERIRYLFHYFIVWVESFFSYRTLHITYRKFLVYDFFLLLITTTEDVLYCFVTMIFLKS